MSRNLIQINIMKLKTPHALSLTSINVFSDKYTEFKHRSLTDGISLQKLVNRCIWLYNNDTDFREKINTCHDLQVSGSSF